jgi:NAD(P)-dependent dehydrogenase (short-subunit alcohol dehydrogenase family)
MSDLLAGLVSVVSGAGAGIGRAIAGHMTEAGSAVVVADIDSARVDVAVAELTAKGAKAVGVVADVSTNAGAAAMLAKALDTFGRLDVVCNNAGIPDHWKQLTEVSDEHWQRNIDVNMTGPFKVCRAAVEIMVKQGHGIIINVASVAGFRGGRSGLAYTVAKHGVIGLTKAVAVEYAAAGIRCNCICPGSVVTSLSGTDGMSAKGVELREKGLATRPPRATPDDIAPAVVFLASDASRYINGANLVIDAGWTAY